VNERGTGKARRWQGPAFPSRVQGNLKRVQVDEIWAFVAAKQKNVPAMKQPVDGAGDVWTWTALDADSKMMAVRDYFARPDALSPSEKLSVLLADMKSKTGTGVSAKTMRTAIRKLAAKGWQNLLRLLPVFCIPGPCETVSVRTRSRATKRRGPPRKKRS
jgi:hypothetical protein